MQSRRLGWGLGPCCAWWLACSHQQPIAAAAQRGGTGNSAEAVRLQQQPQLQAFARA